MREIHTKDKKINRICFELSQIDEYLRISDDDYMYLIRYIEELEDKLRKLESKAEHYFYLVQKSIIGFDSSIDLLENLEKDLDYIRNHEEIKTITTNEQEGDTK